MHRSRLATLALVVICVSSVNGCHQQKPLSAMSFDELIEELASAPDPSPEKVSRIEKAAGLLMHGGDQSHAVLVRHLTDERPSVFFDNYECTVGETCYHILRDQLLDLPEEYKLLCDTEKRFSAGGNYCWDPYMFTPTFSRDANWFHGAGVVEWLAQRKHMSLLEKQIDVREWLIAEELDLGFTDQDIERKYLSPLRSGLATMKRQLNDKSKGR